MNPEAVNLIRELATKLGTTVESLWPHSVRYIAVGGLLDVVAGVALIAASWFVYTRKIRSSEGQGQGWCYDSTDEGMCNIARWAGTGGLFIWGLYSLTYGLLHAVEPVGTLVVKILGSGG